MLRKKTNGVARGPRLSSARVELGTAAVDRRTFLKRSGLTIGGVAAVTTLSGGMVQRAEAQTTSESNVPDVVSKKSVCTHCAVGCTVVAELDHGVWTRQGIGIDSPFNIGGHCAKGAAVRENAHGERRLKHPMKLVDGQWQKVSWDEAINEIGDRMLAVRDTSGPDSVYWLGSAKHSNEQAYLIRKFAAYWGTNNVDHQARICHSSTVAGVANTWGYGAMTNSFNDIHNSRAMILFGSNPAEAHPVSLVHLLKAKEENNAPLIVCDPRFTRTAAHADEYVRMRPGTDVALVWGILYHIFKNGWQDKNYIRERVWGMDEIQQEVSKWTPELVERVTGVPGSQLERVARTLANNRPATLVWCMGGTQHTNGSSNTRAYSILQLALGNIGKSGGGANIFRGHDNVQGATDLGVLADTLPGYYGLTAGSWAHWARVWEEDLDWLKGRFATMTGKDGKSKPMMNETGIPVSRWIDGVLEAKENIAQPDNTKVMVFWGHAPNSQTRLPEMRKAMGMLDTLVVIDPYPTMTAVLQDRKDGVYLLPATTQFETYGSVTASNRSIQWREKVIDPLFESKVDHEIMYLFAQKFGFADKMFRNIEVKGTEPVVEDITREWNRGMWTIGMTGQSPERLKSHMEHQYTFDKTTLRAVGGPHDGEFYGLPWPCWGTPEIGHPGSAVLYNTSIPVAQGGMGFRARFGVERNGQNLLAEGSYPVDSEIEDGYPEFTMGMLRGLGWDKDLTADELATIKKVAGTDDQAKIDGVNWKVDLSGGIQRVAIKHGCAPYGNAKARAVVWTFPDPVPLHREPLYSPDRQMVEQFPTINDKPDFWRLPTAFESVQKTDYSADFPMVLTSGRLVEYEGGGDETRSNPWLAELQQEMFVEINPFDANNIGLRDKDMVWVHSPSGGKVKVAAHITESVGRGVASMPFHFGGVYEGEDLRSHYPDGADPYVLGEASNTAMTYGYDMVTQIQETKATLCRVERA